MFQPKSKSFLLKVAFTVIVSYWLWRCWILTQSRGDLEILTRSIHRLWAGESFYRLSDHAEHTKPPGLTWLLQPLALLPSWTSKIVWDLLSWGSLIVLAKNWLGLSLFSWTGLLGWLLAAGPWWAEMRLGQFNMFLAAVTLYLPVWESRAPSPFRSRVLGAGALFCVLLKPTQILLWPFMFSRVAREGGLRQTLIGAIILGVIVAVGYGAQLGWSDFFVHHQQWLQFLPQSEAKHLLRPDNLGISTQQVRWLLPDGINWVPKIVLLFGLVLACWSTHGAPSLSRRVFLNSVLISIVCSPMAWRQNFSPLMLCLSWEAVMHGHKYPYWRRLAFWLSILGFELLATDLLGVVWSEWFARVGGPLALALSAWALMPVQTQVRPQTSG